MALLYLRALDVEITNEQRNVLVALELVHNASLIHDDVIDSATIRRGEKTLNAQFDSNLAVVSGDYLLALALEKVVSTNSIAVVKMFATTMKDTCLGEANQYFSKFRIPKLNDYIEKTKAKQRCCLSLVLRLVWNFVQTCLLDIKRNAKNFAENFGIGFQIRDDLINALKSDKIVANDISEGVYNAPMIFAAEENPDILKSENLIEAIKNTNYVEKTKDLLDNYFDKAVSIVQGLGVDNVYKNSLLDVINLLKKSV